VQPKISEKMLEFIILCSFGLDDVKISFSSGACMLNKQVTAVGPTSKRRYPALSGGFEMTSWTVRQRSRPRTSIPDERANPRSESTTL